MRKGKRAWYAVCHPCCATITFCLQIVDKSVCSRARRMKRGTGKSRAANAGGVTTTSTSGRCMRRTPVVIAERSAE